MYRVTIYRDNVLIDDFMNDLMSRAVGKAKEKGRAGDLMYVHEVIQTADGEYEEVECVLRATI
jgi:hypothetical protein|tara:strand:+ start:377 stop:565 length:189 start_codon:yes stop_codon:yes gene_type:complete